jgi:hypothetical protein
VTDADVAKAVTPALHRMGRMKRRPATGEIEIEFDPEPLHRRNSGYTAPR